ncbi:MAG: amidohydrolase [Candidatus Cloacimonadota bacterium]|nr:amidohydrolase [Candidatus Cloacimonadota bacterium]
MNKGEKIKLIDIRKKLHKNPELSGKEKNTSEYIIEILKKLSPDEIITEIGGFGTAAIFDSGQHGATIMFRAELDALPIIESNNFSYKSGNTGISHKCGHDGHMTILIGLAERIKRENFKGKIILLFQPAEETAKGAKRIVEDTKFKFLKPDYIFALHNLPGFTKGTIILRKGIFTSTSIGMIIKLKGETSHAGHPENGNNPALAMTKIINELDNLSKNIQDSAMITIIYAKLGEIAFGTSAGKAVIMATFRSNTKNTLKIMQNKAISLVKEKAEKQNLDYEIEWVEYFPEIVNDDECVDIVKKSAKNIRNKIKFIEQPFTWTEDFSYFTQKIKGAFFGLGSGKNHPQLHNSDYDFPDEIISDGINIFVEIIKEICRRK